MVKHLFFTFAGLNISLDQLCGEL